MKNIFIISLLIILSSCGKPKSVTICGDHVCINKAEAKKYFEENLTIEVKIVNKKKQDEIDLVQLNLNNSNNERKVFIKKKNVKNIYFLIGADNLVKFHKWKSWKKIVKLVKLIVFSRRGYDRKGMKSMVVKNFKNKIIFIKNKHIAISSSQLKSQTKSKN